MRRKSRFSNKVQVAVSDKMIANLRLAADMREESFAVIVREAIAGHPDVVVAGGFKPDDSCQSDVPFGDLDAA